MPTLAAAKSVEFRAHRGPDHGGRSGKWGKFVLLAAFFPNDFLRARYPPLPPEAIRTHDPSTFGGG